MKASHLFPILSVSISVVAAACLTGCRNDAAAERAKRVVVYTYDSFAGEWGPGAALAEQFHEKTGLTVEFVDCGDAVKALSRAVIEKDAVNADVLLGIDNNTARQALDAQIFEPYKPAGADTIIAGAIKAQLGTGWEMTPYDYSHFALIYDTRSSTPEPTCLEDLTRPEYRKRLILMDPRTSTPGLGFVAWTRAVLGDKFEGYWRALRPSILTMAPGWSAGYGLFTNGEAPLVISYTTSPAANIEYDGISYYKALIFDEGHALQVEGAGVLKGAPNKQGAQAFMDFLISEDAQGALPLTQWMYPVNRAVPLPACYEQGARIPETTVPVDSARLDADVQAVFRILGE